MAPVTFDDVLALPRVEPDVGSTFLEAARAVGDAARLRYVVGAGHFDLVYPGSVAWDTVAATLREHA